MLPLLFYALTVTQTGGSGSPALTVDQAVALALSQSPRMRAARFERAATLAQNEKERPVALPTVTAQAQGTLQGPRVTFPRAGDGDATVLPERYGKLELDVEQPLYRAGIGSARQRYGAQSRAAGWEERRAENDLILEVRRAYYAQLAAEGAVAYTREAVIVAQKHLDLTRVMVEAGTASNRDVKASEADLAEAQQGAAKSENGVALARATLNRLLGRDLSVSGALVPPPAPAVPVAPDEGVRTALARRPEIRLLEENRRAAHAGASLAAKQNLPTLSARATASTQTPSAFVRSEYYGASLVFTWTPFDSGRARADVHEARAREDQIEALIEDTRLGLRLEVEKAWRDMREAAARIQVADTQVASAEAAASVSELRYQARMATQLEVSSAMNAAARARASREQARFDLLTAAAEYAHATGVDVREP